MTRFQEKIQSQRSSFTPAQERIAAFVLDNTLEAALLTATELAQRVEVDPATVVRFAQKLGYQGYLELKTELGRMVRTNDSAAPTPSGSIGQALEEAHRSLTGALNTLWKSIDRSELIQVVELLGMPYHLLLLSDGTCGNTAGWLAVELRDRGFRIANPGEDPEALAESMLSPEVYDRALILEAMTPSPTLEHIAQELQRKKIRSLAIVGSTASQVARSVDSALILQPLQDAATYPSILRQLLTTILLAVQQLQESYVNPGELKGDAQGEGLRGENTL